MASSQLNNVPTSKKIMQAVICTSEGKNRGYKTERLEMCHFPNGEPCLRMRKIFKFHVTTPDIFLYKPHLTVHALAAHNIPGAAVPLHFGEGLLSTEPQQFNGGWVFTVHPNFVKVGRGPKKGETPNLAFLELTLSDNGKHVATSYFNIRVFNEKPQTSQKKIFVPCLFASFHPTGTPTPRASPFYTDSQLWSSSLSSFKGTPAPDSLDSKPNLQFASIRQDQNQLTSTRQHNSSLANQTTLIKNENNEPTPMYSCTSSQESDSSMVWGLSFSSVQITCAQSQWPVTPSSTYLKVESISPALHALDQSSLIPDSSRTCSGSLVSSLSTTSDQQVELFSDIPAPQEATLSFDDETLQEILNEVICNAPSDPEHFHQEQLSTPFGQDFGCNDPYSGSSFLPLDDSFEASDALSSRSSELPLLDYDATSFVNSFLQ